MSDSILRKVMEDMKDLPDELQEQVLEFVESLTTSVQHGVIGRNLLRFAGTIPAADLQAMRQAIELGCEQVDVNEW